MRRWRRTGLAVACFGLVCALGWAESCLAAPAAARRSDEETALRERLDAPLLFVKRLNYLGIHIYDTYYKWRPGGGIYVLENPAEAPDEHTIRPVIDSTTTGTLGDGIYSDPELSWDAKRLLFCYKPTANGSTSIYEIGVDGKGRRRLTDPVPYCAAYKGRNAGIHDVAPAYLPDGRIVFLSSRPSGLVPCNNTGVAILHVMNADGSDIHPISVNNVNEFDPAVLPDGRVLFGRWEYIDKTALTQQSLWTVFPDGTNETALFANNMVRPEALLDARPVPGEPALVVSSFTRHNAPPRGKVGFVDFWRAKNGGEALFNLEDHNRPTVDTGDSCEPWPLSKDVVVYSGKAKGHKLNAILMIHRNGQRALVYADPQFDLHSPMPVKPRKRPPVIADADGRGKHVGRFYLQDVYQGLGGVARGEVASLRVIQETSRTSASPGGAMNQTFLMSGALAWSAKNVLGVVPVEDDGSAYFEVPAGRTLYWQALDRQGRLIQSMRTFVQAVPGVTRSCIGCHEYKFSAPASVTNMRAVRRDPDRPKPESWGSGFIDYPSMIQPILSNHCAGCHGGEKGFAAGLDLTGGWTQYFSISYENLVSRRDTQLTAHLIAGIDCMNGTSLWSARIFPPRSHGSAVAPLARILVNGHKGHKGRFGDLSRRERDLMLAWIDTNGLYYGTWDYTRHGCSLKPWPGIQGALVAEMRKAGCTRCHGDGKRAPRFESDWFNLERPELSRILRAPLPKGKDGWGQGLCRDRKVDPTGQRICILAGGRYAHSVLPLENFNLPGPPLRDASGEAVVTFASTADPHYQAMLAIIRDGRRKALAAPRVDMPGAEVVPGSFRQFVPTPLPEPLPPLLADVDAESVVHLTWERSARTIGLAAEVHRSTRPDFVPSQETLVTKTTRFQHADAAAPQGTQHYALVFLSEGERSVPVRAAISVPAPQPPPSPSGLAATPASGRVDLRWEGADEAGLRYHVYRAREGADDFQRLSAEPTPELAYSDGSAGDGVRYAYTVRAVSRRGAESAAPDAVVAAALPVIREPIFTAAFAKNLDAALYGGGAARGKVHGKARVADGALDLRQGGHVTFAHRPDFDLTRQLSVECWVQFTEETQMPVVVSCGHWNQAGWFLQRIGGGWRWHVGGIDCDGGKPAPGRWTHLVGTFDGRTARLFQDGRLVAEKGGHAIQTPWKGPLHVGQYSGGPGPQYQVTGWIAGLRFYSRALPAEDAKAASETTRPPAYP